MVQNLSHKGGSRVTTMELCVLLIAALRERREAISTSTVFVCTSVGFPPSFSPSPPSLVPLSLHLGLFVSTHSAHCISRQTSIKSRSSSSTPTNPTPTHPFTPPPHSHHFHHQRWRTACSTQVYPQVGSLSAESLSCDRSMTKPVTAPQCYFGLDCVWRSTHYNGKEL